jgi:uncharacterized protein (DUF305 family)
MAHRVRFIAPALILLSPLAGWAQQTSADFVAPIVQPGAPGKAGKMLTPETAVAARQAPSKPDIEFMQGMIMHHSQAVEMTELLRTRSQNKDLQAMGNRISISQTDEIKYMKQWLQERGQPLTMSHGMDMKGMDHSMPGMNHNMPGMDHSATEMMMPGMLTPQQMKALEQASGPQFDHLFLTGMIQHHTGALTMVQDLFETPGAGQDAALFDFASDVDNTQRAEIRIMQGMLSKEKK